MNEITDLNQTLAVSGKFCRIARLKDEPYEVVPDAKDFAKQLKKAGAGADVFSFSQRIGETEPKYDLPHEFDTYAVLPITTYDDWFKNQIDFKTRNKVRKVGKNGVELRQSELTDDFVRGVIGIYNESPFVQGRKNWHYQKSLEEMRKMLGTFPDRSIFVGAYFKDEMVGFIKLIYAGEIVNFIHIISKVAHRDKAPTNGLLAKAIEISAARKAKFLHYGIWARRGMGVFKINHCFVPQQIPRYYVPLNLKGALALKLKLHQPLRSRIPEKWVDKAVDLRNRWTAFRQGKNSGEATASAPAKLDIKPNAPVQNPD
jgi:hypothetical protein